MRRLATRINAQGRRVQRRNLSVEGRGTTSKWEKLNKIMGALAHLDPHSGEVHWNPAIKEELERLHILETEEDNEDEQEKGLELEAQGDEEEEDQNGIGLDREEEEEESMAANHRRDENDES